MLAGLAGSASDSGSVEILGMRLSVSRGVSKMMSRGARRGVASALKLGLRGLRPPVGRWWGAGVPRGPVVAAEIIMSQTSAADCQPSWVRCFFHEGTSGTGAGERGICGERMTMVWLSASVSSSILTWDSLVEADMVEGAVDVSEWAVVGVASGASGSTRTADSVGGAGGAV